MMQELILEADRMNLPLVQSFIDEQLEAVDCPMPTRIAIDVAVEELFVNIASYAYAPDTGEAVITAGIDGDSITIGFRDKGVPFDPLARTDPDVTLSAEERGIGGLGIFLVKKTMDDMTYQYKDGHNIVCVHKKIRA